MKVSVIIPTYNEEGCIGRVLRETPREVVDEVIIVDGHSTDKTLQEVRAALRPQDKLIMQKGSGYGGAILEGIEKATGDVVIIMDADGSHNPKEISAFLEKVEQGYEYVMASRYAPGAKSEDDTIIRWIGNQVFTWLTNIVHKTKVTDVLYLYAAITRDGLQKLNLKSTGFEFCIEILVKAHCAGLKFAEIPTVERARFAGKSKLNAFWDGFRVLGTILRRYNN